MKEVIPPSKCTGCGACSIACPVCTITMDSAITMQNTPDGFLYSVIDQEACIDCKRCRKVCPVLNPPKKMLPETVFAAQSPNTDVLRHSASGGAFFELATAFLAEGGSVYGATMKIENSQADIFHLAITEQEDLTQLQGSKYAQGRSYPSFKEIRAKLIQGEQVLFSGLPCQVAGLYGYLEKKYDTLTTVDIFCHGNTSLDQLNCYLAYLKDKYHSDINEYIFRDKERGVGYKPKVTLKSGKTIRQTTFQEAYWYLFQNSKFYRESCYSCPYASPERISDISIGDFWGIEQVRPELLSAKGGKLNERYGISAVLANTKKGKALIQATRLVLEDSAIGEVASHGAAIRGPQVAPEDRAKVLEMFREKDFAQAKAYAKRQLGLYYYLDLLSDTQLVKLAKKILSL